MRSALLACALAACNFRPGTISSGDGAIIIDSDPRDGIDAPSDALAGLPDASVCYGTGLVRACFAAAPSGGVTINANIDTDTSNLCDDDPRNAAWCVVAGASVSVTGVVGVTGLRPLVLVSTSTIVVSGAFDASSKRGGQVGAGANAAGCNPGTAPSGAMAGGAGGSFGGMGGNGSGTGAGSRGATVMPTTLRGGCPGQNGGGGNAGGARGNGGGALSLIAEASITVSGAINASGAGGGAGTNPQGGGGGGGSGGLIAFDAPSVAIGGVAFANGGGGGEGGTAGGNSGEVGQDPLTFNNAAPGGSTSSSGGDGGDGSVGTTLDGSNAGAPSGGGGGGGGGGAGVIRLYRATSIAGNASPPAT